MSLREQFEAWLKANYPGIVDHWVDDPDGETEAMWQAYQAGHAVNADLIEACEQCLRHIEQDESTHGRPFAAGNVARDAIKKAKG